MYPKCTLLNALSKKFIRGERKVCMKNASGILLKINRYTLTLS